jgi:Holliday junction DNA helicase RuvB
MTWILVGNVIPKYLHECKLNGIYLSVNDDVLDLLVDTALKQNTGARGLTAALEGHLSDILFQAYSSIGVKQARLVVRDGQIGHTLLSGPPGLGKTTLARLIAKEMDSKVIELIGSNIQCPEQLTAQLVSLKQFDILFIDEIHSLSRATEEILYSAMQDRRISIVQNNYDDLMKTLGMTRPNPTVMTCELPDFCLIGASTLSGLVSAPLRSRFVQTLTLEPYADHELKRIIANAAKAQSFPLSINGALQVARRSRSCARTAIQNLR